MSLQKTVSALADPTRREILRLLKGGRMAAGEIAGRFPVSGASVSRHLAVLRDAELIRDTREGKFIYYELNASVLEEVMIWISDLRGGEEHAQAQQVEDTGVVPDDPSANCGGAHFVG